MVAVASECKQLTTLSLFGCRYITDVAVVAVVSGCKQLTTLYLGGNSNITQGLRGQWQTTAPTSLDFTPFIVPCV